MSAKYLPVKQNIVDDADDNILEANETQLQANLQSLYKAKLRTQFFALLAAVSIIWNLSFILQGPDKLSNELYPDIVPQS